MGGEITWRTLGQDTFIVTLTKYRDCNGTTMSPATIMIRCFSTGAYIGSYNFYSSAPVDITPGSAQHISNCTTGSIKDNRCTNSNSSFPYGIEKYVYTGTIILSGSLNCCELTISHQDYNRNTSITTGAAGYPFYIEAKLNRCLPFKDNSPVFNNTPLPILCINQPFVYNMGATDGDTNVLGNQTDSLAYEFIPPMYNLNEPTPWLSPYTYEKPIMFKGWPNAALPFSPAGLGIHLDRYNGDLMFTPTTLQQTVMSILVKEYRNDTLIGDIRRDIQIIVINCPNNSPPSLSGPFYKEVCAGDTVSFDIRTQDPNFNDTVKISFDSTIHDARWTANNCQTKRPVGNFVWVPKENNVREAPYNFTITAKDDATPINATYIKSYQVKVLPLPKAQVGITNEFCSQYRLIATRLSGFNPVYIWNINNLSLYGAGPHDIQLKGSQNYGYILNLTADFQSHHCSRIYQGTIYTEQRLYCDLGQNKETCFGDSITISPTLYNQIGKVHYRWNNSITDTLSKLNFIVTKDTIVRLVVTDSLNCHFNDSIYITCIKLPSIDFNDIIYKCYGRIAAISPGNKFSQLHEIDFQWYDHYNKLLSEDSVLYTAIDGEYYLKIKNQLGCEIFDSFELLDNQEIEKTLKGIKICEGEFALLENKKIDSLISYQWYLDTIFIGNSAKLYVKPHISSEYKVIFTQKLNNIICKDTGFVKVEVGKRPEILLKTVGSICQNQNAILLDSCVIKPKGGEWNSRSTGFINNNRFVPILSNIGYNVLYYQYTDSLSKCYGLDSLPININKIPDVKAGEDQKICIDQGIYLLNGHPDNGFWTGKGLKKYNNKWCFDPGIDTIEKLSLYKLVYSYFDSNKCYNSDSLKITVIRNEKKAFIFDTTVCFFSEPINLQLIRKGIWTGSGVNSGKFFPNLAAEGINNLKCEYLNEQCKEYVEISINVLPKTKISAGNDTNVCSNQGLIRLIGNPRSGMWLGENIVDNEFFNTNIQIQEEKAFSLIYQIIDQNGCKSTETKVITVKPSPFLKIESLQDTVLCYDKNPLIFQAQYFSECKLNWAISTHGSDGVLIKNNNEKLISYQPGQNDLNNRLLTIKLSAVFENSECPNSLDSINIRFYSLPEPDFAISSSNGCVPLSVSFLNISKIIDDTIVRYIWDFGDQKISDTLNPEHEYIYPGNYSVKLQAISSHGCATELLKKDMIFANVVTKADFIPDPGKTLMSIPTIRFNNTSSPLTDNILFLWNFGDYKNQNDGGRSNIPNPEYKYFDTGQYKVTLVVYNQYGCKDSTTKDIYILDDIQVFIPNAFTPDNKGPEENEIFKIKANAIDKFNLAIYDMTGNLVYTSDNYQLHGWNGLILNKGKPAQLGSYVYFITVTSLDQTVYKFKGIISLIR